MTIAPTRESNRAPAFDPAEVLIREARRRGRRHRLAVGLIVLAVAAAGAIAAVALSTDSSRTRTRSPKKVTFLFARRRDERPRM